MSIRTVTYQQLAKDSELKESLAAKPKDLGYGPAIYEQWAAPGTEMPYINLMYSTAPGEGLIKRVTTLNIDIFTDGYDTMRTEAIAERIKLILDLAIIQDPTEGPVRYYLEGESDIPEPVEGVTHWNLTFNVQYWRKAFIGALNNREG